MVDLDQPLTPGKIPSSNSYMLSGLVQELGAIPLCLGIARDSRSDIESKLEDAAKADLILTTGGVSMGDFDLIKDVLTSGDNRMEFCQVAMKPGKSTVFGFTGGIPTIGLPGSPAAALLSFYQFARPAILTLLGAAVTDLPRLKARLITPIKKKAGLPYYILGLMTGGEELRARPGGEHGTGILASMAAANCFIVIPEDKGFAPAGELVDCEVFGTVLQERI